MKTLSKALTPFALKAMDAEQRVFEGLASTWQVDSGRDRIMPGAYKRTLSHWRQSGRSLPLIDQHDYSSVTRTRLGKLLEAEEREDGLWTKFRVFETSAGNDFMALLREGGVDGLSIGYSVVGEPEIKDGTRILRELRLAEISAVHWGMNEGALIDQTSVKSINDLSAALKDGRFTKEQVRALLNDDSGEDSAAPAATPTVEEVKGLAPEQQDALRQRLLSLNLRRLTGSNRYAGSDFTRTHT